VAGAAGGGGPPGDAAGPVEFDGRMTPPVKLSGPDPRYTPEAIAREIEGTMTVRCVVGVSGTVRECQVVRGLPYLDGAVVHALERRVYRPATLAGAPVEVSYVFRISMRLP
jgi:protein TonB